ncbi:MAG TPA: uroporphyrinogen decarboxylase family protein [Desulfobacterales bacterium]|nr:uroporphyrinogen decarboxylase family protein [Desulfobacterales bacterium]
MTPRERVVRALTFARPDRAPRDLWALPGVGMRRAAELERMKARHPSDFGGPGLGYGRGLAASGDAYRLGGYTDEWGCTFEVYEEGVVGEIKRPPLADWSALDRLRPPRELLDVDWSVADRARDGNDRFILAGTSIRPFERMQFLRGTENLFMDLASGDARALRLRSMVHEFYLEELSHWVERDVDGISFMDDWGTQNALLVSPAMWREIYKPLYREYAAMIRGAGKHVFFHSDGNIAEIIPDLVEIGVTALNSQLFCMDIENIGRRFRGRITFWGEIDRQHVLPLGSEAEVRDAVRRVRRALDHGRGGVIAQCEWGIGAPKANIEAVFDEWMKPRPATE